MSGVIRFGPNGVIHLVENSAAEASNTRRKVLIHLPTGEVVSSYDSLERILTGLGWERYFGGDPELFQFHKRSSIDLISLPRDFSKFNSVYMYDIVIKNPQIFHVRDMWDGTTVPRSWNVGVPVSLNEVPGFIYDSGVSGVALI